MIYLLDTHILLWWVLDSPALPDEARKLISDPGHTPAVSPVSFWEISIKRSLGKLDFHGDLETILQAGPFHPIVVTPQHAWAAGHLPLHHKDPFDRMLVAQAQIEGLTLLTHDHSLSRYGKFVRIV